MFWAAQSTLEETFNAHKESSRTPQRNAFPSGSDPEKQSPRFMSDKKTHTLVGMDQMSMRKAAIAPNPTAKSTKK
jgi:hypothetical protein